MSKRSIISLRHFAPVVCMIFLGDPDCWFTSHARAARDLSLSGEPRDLRIYGVSQPHIKDILTISHHIYLVAIDELISNCYGGLMPDHRNCNLS